MRLYPTRIAVGTGECGGDCYRELPRILLLGISWNAKNNLLGTSKFIADSSPTYTIAGGKAAERI